MYVFICICIYARVYIYIYIYVVHFNVTGVLRMVYYACDEDWL